MSIQDTKERIFVNGQIYSRPRFGGPVHGPDTRRFTPDPNPYDVAPEPRGYGQGTVDDLLFRPGIDKFEIENPVLRPGDTFKIVPLNTPSVMSDPRVTPLDPRATPFVTPDPLVTPFVTPDPLVTPSVMPDLPRDQFIQDLIDSLINRGITEQNQEVMGSKEQVFPRYANPEDGTLNNEEMARVDPIDKLLLKSLRKGEIGDPSSPRIRKAIIDLEKKIYNDGRASSMDGALMAADPSFEIPREVSPQEVNRINRRVISDYEKKKEMLRRGFLAPLLRGV